MLSHVTKMIHNKYVKIAIYLSIYLISVVFTVMCRSKYHSNAFGNSLFLEIDKIASSFQFKQILASIILFMIGYCIVAMICPFATELSKLILSMPMGIALWGLSSVTLLILRIPYTKVTSFAGFVILVVVLLLLNRSRFSSIRGINLLQALMMVSILANVFSTGYPRYTGTSDTYYCVYAYGRLIASAGKLSVNTVGNLLETTGIMPALMSSFAVFCGFETIQVMHYILMTSLIAGIVVYLYKVFSNYFTSKYRSMFLSLFLMITATSPLFLLYDLIISHSWIMVYMFFTVTLAEEVLRVDNRETRASLICILSLFFSWMTLCRVEAIVTVVFIIVCISYLGLSRKEIAICASPAMILAVIFHAENQIMIAVDIANLPYGSVFVTKSILLMMAAVVILMAAYLLLYEKAWVKYLRIHMPMLLIGLLLFASVVFCIKDFERTGDNFKAVFYNLTSISERWYYFPFFAMVMLIWVVRNKQHFGYWDMLVLGLNLVFFCMSMGRIQPLRNGWGDSFNRYLLHMTPLMLVYFAKGLAPKLPGESKEKMERNG